MAFLSPAVAALEPACTGDGQRIALVVGNAAYRPALPNPRNDAADMRGALCRLGFTVLHLENADKRGLLEALRDFSGRLDGDSVALFYYAGHAVQYAADKVKSENYLLPVGAEIHSQADLEFEALNVQRVVQHMRGRLNLLILDACRDSPYAWSRGGGVSRGLARMDKTGGFLVAYATQAGRVAADGNGRNSPYTAALLRHLEQPGLSVLELFNQVSLTVTDSTRASDIPQEPLTEYSALPPFCFAGCAKPDDGRVSDLQARLAEREAEIERLRRASENRDNTAPSGVIPPAQKGERILRYIAYPDGTALDTETGLMWMRCSLGQTWDGATCQGKAKEFIWEDAKKQTANFAGYGDWRLPRIQELNTLVYCSNGKPAYFTSGFDANMFDGDLGCEGNPSESHNVPTVVQGLFPNMPLRFVFALPPDANSSDDAWGVDFYTGNGFDSDRSNGNHVRLVRGGQ